MSEDRVDTLLDVANSKAESKFNDSYHYSHEAEMLAVHNVLLAELIETIRERLPPNVPE